MTLSEGIKRTFKHISKMLARPSLWGCACIFFYIAWSATACTQKSAETKVLPLDSLPFTSLTKGIETLISDSGITKYKVLTDEWYTYDQPEDIWYFPEGVYLEQFDTLFNVEASVQADTAYYYMSQKLWELIGRVEILNREGDRFYAERLFWDESKEQIYSHSYIRIERLTGQLLESDQGFTSNQSMTDYVLYAPFGHIDVDEDEMAAPTDSVATAPADSLERVPAVK